MPARIDPQTLIDDKKVTRISRKSISDKLDSIKPFIDEGCQIIALVQGGNIPDSQLAENGTKRAITTNVGVVESWLNKNHHINFGVFTPPTMLIIDVDIKKGALGLESMSALESEHGVLPETRRVETPSGGYHLYFTVPAGSLTSRNNISAGIDIRCAGGYYAAVPPSMRPHGKYSWVSKPFAPCADLPSAWVQALAIPAHIQRERAGANASSRDWMATREAAFRESHPHSLSPIHLFVKTQSVRDIMNESGLWKDFPGSDKLLSTESSTGIPGCLIITTDEQLEIVRDYHGKVFPDTEYVNAFQLKKHIYMKTESLDEDSAYQNALGDANALIPSEYEGYAQVPAGMTVGALNAIAVKTKIPAMDVRDITWFLAEVDKLATLQGDTQPAVMALLQNFGRYTSAKVLDAAAVIDKLGKHKLMPQSTSKSALKESEKVAQLSRGVDELSVMVAEMNQTHHNAIIGGKNMIVVFATREEVLEGTATTQHYVDFTAPKELRAMYLNKPHFMLEDSTGKVRAVNQLDAWMTNPKSNTCPKGTFFLPSPPGTPIPQAEGQLNLFTGWSTKPAKGDWSVVRDHFRYILCDGNEKAFAYLLNWMARFVQQPDRQGRVIPVFQGEKRTGKGLGIEFLVKVAGRHAMTISNSDHLLGKYNGHLEDKTLVFADEALFVGDHAAMNRLKSLAMESRMTIERKYMTADSKPNRLSIMMATNEAFVVPATWDDVRYFVNMVSSRRKGDTKYFKRLYAAVSSIDVQAAFLQDMLDRDISDFNVEEVPMTEALEIQIEYALQPMWHWWLECLRTRTSPVVYETPFDESQQPWVQDISAAHAFVEFTAWCDAQKISQYHRLTQSVWGREFHKVYRRRLSGAKRTVHYVVGSHREAAQAFADYQHISLAAALERTAEELEEEALTEVLS